MKVTGIEFQETVISLETKDFKARITTLSGAGQGAGAHRRRCADLGIAGDPRISGGEISGRRLYGRRMRWRGLMPAPSLRKCMPGFCRCGGNLPMNVCTAGQIARARRWRGGRHHADRCDLDRMPRQMVRRSIFLWSVRRGRRHVCAGGLAFPHLCGRGERGRARLHARRHGLPAWAEWRDAARRETWVLPHDEIDWPEVKGMTCRGGSAEAPFKFAQQRPLIGRIFTSRSANQIGNTIDLREAFLARPTAAATRFRNCCWQMGEVEVGFESQSVDQSFRSFV